MNLAKDDEEEEEEEEERERERERERKREREKEREKRKKERKREKDWERKERKKEREREMHGGSAHQWRSLTFEHSHRKLISAPRIHCCLKPAEPLAISCVEAAD